jgi:multiple sugar transport system permease protein
MKMGLEKIGLELATSTHKGLSQKQRESMFFLIIVSPWILGFLLFTLFPIVSSLLASFTSWDIITPPEFIGVGNYIQMIKDSQVWQSLMNTLYYTAIGVPATIIFGLFIAILVSQRIKGIYMFRSFYYLPCVLSGVATAFVWKWLLHPMFGPVNYYLFLLGVDGPGWLADPLWSKRSIVLYRMWFIGGTMMIFLAGLNAIPREYYEAAEIDGASKKQCFWRITLPLLTPSIFFCLITGIIASLQIFGEVYIMMGSSADEYTRPFLHYLWMQAFTFQRMGYASALTWVLFIIIFVVTLIQLIMQKRWVYYEVDK